MAALNSNQKDIKQMFDLLESKNISVTKYERLLQKIGKYADSVGETAYFKQILKEAILAAN